MIKRALAFVFVTVTSVAVFAQPPQPPATEQYISVDKLPPTEQMPSAPYVIAAYALIWLIAMFYLWTIWRRIGKVEQDINALARRKDSVR
jgi:hypothetical protein